MSIKSITRIVLAIFCLTIALTVCSCTLMQGDIMQEITNIKEFAVCQFLCFGKFSRTDTSTISSSKLTAGDLGALMGFGVRTQLLARGGNIIAHYKKILLKLVDIQYQ